MRSRLASPGAHAAASPGARAAASPRLELAQPPRLDLVLGLEPGSSHSRLYPRLELALGFLSQPPLLRCYLQKRVLNSSKGPAVRALRAQPDKREYAIEMKNSVESTENLFIREAMATEVLIGKNDTIEGVCTFFSMDFMHHLLYLAPEHS
ncbi:hypothetical protein ZEAMMB73_Zm00001d021241 [Zea mays]|uniref:MnmG N-terminal domain-containing protein n=1 Tax=Zea mays TaxID=4577 RepID=A0A1D6I9A3_MAIZE|nr:hypothetical protein ZEAMMB73_Zm00001d021241 [Zea mays]